MRTQIKCKKMARKIRVTESELVAMIETIITTEKRDKNVIKLSEGDLNKIIKKVNEKIHMQEEVGAPKGIGDIGKEDVGAALGSMLQTAKTALNPKISQLEQGISVLQGKDDKSKAAGIAIIGTMLGIENWAKIAPMLTQFAKAQAAEAAKAKAGSSTAPVQEGIMDALKGLFGKSPESPKGEKWMVTYKDPDYEQKYGGYTSEAEARQAMSDLVRSHNMWKGNWDVKKLS